MTTAAEQIAAIREVQARRPVDVRGELEPYDGPEPSEEYLSEREADLRADIDFHRTQRSGEWFT